MKKIPKFKAKGKQTKKKIFKVQLNPKKFQSSNGSKNFQSPRPKFQKKNSKFRKFSKFKKKNFQSSDEPKTKNFKVQMNQKFQSSDELKTKFR